MKKAYSAPDILFESFTLSTNIAGDCEAPYVNNASKGTCAVLGTGDVAVFDSKVGDACDFNPSHFGQPEDFWGELCYHVPSADNNLFNS